jgi:hypothetical protein
MKQPWAPTAVILMNSGYNFTGTCGCQSRARTYRKASWSAVVIKIYPNIARIKLFLHNQSQTPYENFTKITELIEMGEKAEMAAREQRKDSAGIRS